MTDSLQRSRSLLQMIEGTGLDHLELGAGAARSIAAYLKKRGLKQVVIAADANTYKAAGEEVIRSLEAEGIIASLCLLKPNEQGDVAADELSVMELFLETAPVQSDALIAVGSGTIHDITRFVSHRMCIPFVSVPTAPSVDGFTSAGAPLIVRGVKKTIPAVAPIAIFADLDILTRAPQPLVAAGFGDMLGKYTSLFDWKFSHHTGGEPYNEQAAGITENALESCVKHVREIADRSEAGISILMTALIESGIAMLLFGQSHPASGAEHHLSHYWEMEYLRRGKRALLHGAKVGAAAAEISKLYHQAADEGLLPGNEPDVLLKNRKQVREWLKKVPQESEIRELLKLAGGPVSCQELGIDEELFRESLRQAHTVRDRRTFLRALNEA